MEPKIRGLLGQPYQVHHHQYHRNPGLRGVLQPSLDSIQPVSSLTLPELTLYRVPVTGIVINLVLLRRTAQLLAHKPYPELLQVSPVLTVAVDPVTHHLGRIIPVALPVQLHRSYQIASLVVGLP